MKKLFHKLLDKLPYVKALKQHILDLTSFIDALLTTLKEMNELGFDGIRLIQKYDKALKDVLKMFKVPTEWERRGFHEKAPRDPQ